MRKGKLRNPKIHPKLEEWTQLIKKLTLFKRSWSRVIELSMTYFFDIKVPFLRLLPVESGGKLKNPKLRNNFSRIHSKFCSGQITYWMGDYEIFRHEIKKMMRRLRKLTVRWASPMYPSRRTKEILLSPFQAFLPSKTYSAKWHPLPARPDIEFCGRTNEKFFSLQTFNQVQIQHPTVLVKVSQVNLL